MTLLALVLGVTAVVAAVGGVLLARGGWRRRHLHVRRHRADRELWWGLLGALAVVGLVNVPLQAIATMFLVRERGSVWATVGGCLMWVGIGLQATGVAGWASAYFYATDPCVDPSVGSAVIEAANHDQAHLFGLLIPGRSWWSSAP